MEGKETACVQVTPFPGSAGPRTRLPPSARTRCPLNTSCGNVHSSEQIRWRPPLFSLAGAVSVGSLTPVSVFASGLRELAGLLPEPPSAPPD